MRKSILAVLFCLLVSLAVVSDAQADVDFPTPGFINGTPTAIPYGDFYSYSLPILQEMSDRGWITGNYTIPASGGQIKNFDIIYTGEGGIFGDANPMIDNGNTSVMDNAYHSSSGSGTSFGTNNATVNVTVGVGQNRHEETRLFDPTPQGIWNGSDYNFVPQFPGDSVATWDIKVDNLNSYLGNSTLFFLFGNNQEQSDPDLYAWGRASLFNSTTNTTVKVFDFTNSYDSINNTFVDPLVYDQANFTYQPTGADFVLSGGDVFVPAFNQTITHNNGNNDATYAVFSPELDYWVKNYQALGFDTLQGDFRMFDLNGGDETLWIGQGYNVTRVPEQNEIPEPATMMLLGSGLLGLLGARRFSKKS